jgi:zinc transporter ZupT
MLPKLLLLGLGIAVVAAQHDHDHGDDDHDHGDDDHDHDHGDDDHDHDHDHGGNLFEYGGMYHTHDDMYLMALWKVAGKYVDPTVDIAVIPVSESSRTALWEAADAGNHALEHNCTVVQKGGILTTDEHNCYRLVLDDSWYQSVYMINTTGDEHVAIFAQHFLTEFGEDAEMLITMEGYMEEPEFRTSDVIDEESKPWGQAIGAAFVVQLTTLSGIVLLFPAVQKAREMNMDLFNCVIYSFAAGAILAAAFFFILFEATHLVGVGWSEESDVTWRWGTMALAGFLLPSFMELLMGNVLSGIYGTDGEMHTHHDSSAKTALMGQSQDAQSSPKSSLCPQSQVRVISGVVVGDGIHVLVDGLLIGFAFKACGLTSGWSIAMASVAHEVAQEIGDFCVLTGPGGCSIRAALIWNFVSGLAVFVGVIIALAMDVPDEDTGLILAFGGGTYIAIGATECMPRVLELATTNSRRVSSLLAFIVGAVALGLVLLDHEHCVPDSVLAANGGGHGHAH